MTNKNIFNSLGGIDPKLIEEAAPSEKIQKYKRNGWMKWGQIPKATFFSSYFCHEVGTSEVRGKVEAGLHLAAAGSAERHAQVGEWCCPVWASVWYW